MNRWIPVFPLFHQHFELPCPNRALHSGAGVIAAFSLLIITATASAGEWCLGAGITGGYFLFPDHIDGHIAQEYGNSWRGNPYVTAEASTADNSSGYTQTRYTYSHPFHGKERPNLGFDVQATYYSKSGSYFGLELMHRFSARDYYVTHTVRDTFPKNQATVIPHDYVVEEYSSRDHLYVKFLGFGAGMGKRVSLDSLTAFRIGVSAGKANYLNIFRIERTNATTRYYSSSGNEVYSQKGASDFSVQGIQYTSWYIKPSAGLHRTISDLLWVAADISLPLSYIEKGYRWTSEEKADRSTVFYPSGRFVAGNLALTVSLGVHLGRRERGK